MSDKDEIKRLKAELADTRKRLAFELDNCQDCQACYPKKCVYHTPKKQVAK